MRVALMGVLIAAILCGDGLALQDKKIPAPTPAEQKKADEDIRALFKDDLAKKDRLSKRSLAQKLLAQSKDAGNSTAARYVLVIKATDLAAEAGDIATAFDAIEQLDKVYELPNPPLTGATFSVPLNGQKAALLAIARKAASTPEEQNAVADAYLRISESCLASRDLEDAKSAAQQAAKNSKEQDVLSRSADLIKDVAGLKQEEEAGQKAEAALVSKPDDPAATEAMGKYLLFSKKEEEKGLNLLTKSSNSDLQDIAKRELSHPTDAESLQEIGNRWLGLADKESTPFLKRRYQERGLKFLYATFDASSGLAKMKAEKRIDEIWTRMGLVPPTVGLAGLWSFEEGTGSKAADSSSKGNHGTIGNGVEWGQGKIGKALKFNGTGGQVTLPPQVNANLLNTFTVAFWALPDASAADGNRFALYPTENGIPGKVPGHVGVGISVSAKTVQVFEHGGGYFPTVAKAEADMSTWTHIAVVYKNRVPSLYINGRLAATGNVSAKEVHPGHPIGGGTNGFIKGYYSGLLDEVRLYSVALSDAGISVLARRVPAR